MNQINKQAENINDIEQNENQSLKDLIIAIKKWTSFLYANIKLILTVAVIFTFIFYYIARTTLPKYKAMLTFVLEEDKGGGGGGFGGALGIASQLGFDLGSSAGGSLFSNTNINAFMKSRFIVEKVLLSEIEIKGKKTNLAEYFLLVKGKKNAWQNNNKLSGLKFYPIKERENFTLIEDSVLKSIYAELVDKNSLEIGNKDKKITIINVEVSNGDEQFAKIFCEKLVQETSNYYIETKSKKARLNFEMLQKQTDSIRIELGSSMKLAANESDKIFNLNPTFLIKQAPVRQKQIDVQANTSILSQLIQNLEMAKVNLRKETPLVQIIDKPTFPLDQEKPDKLKYLILGFLTGALLSSFLLITYDIYKKAIA